MGLGVLEDRRMEHVPGASSTASLLTAPLVDRSAYLSTGTAFVLDDASRPVDPNVADSGLKYDTSGKVPVILVPQPSDDPNDPLVRVILCYNLMR